MSHFSLSPYLESYMFLNLYIKCLVQNRMAINIDQKANIIKPVCNLETLILYFMHMSMVLL